MARPTQAELADYSGSLAQIEYQQNLAQLAADEAEAELEI